MPSKNQKCPGCKHRRSISGAGDTNGRVCQYSIDTDELRGCSAKECYEKKIHFDNGKHSNPRRHIAVLGRPKIKVGKFDTAGHLLVIYESKSEAAKAEGLTIAGLNDRIMRGAVINGACWRGID